MPTVPQIAAAKNQLVDPNPYTDNSKLSADSVATLHIFLRKYLADRHKAGRYTLVKDKLAAARGVDAAQLQAVLNNVSAAGSKKALLKGEVEYSTQETIDNELEFALLVMYEPVGSAIFGSRASNMAASIRAEFSRQPACSERERTIDYNG